MVSCGLVSSAFGPYLLADMGLRLDHVVIYGFFVFLFCAAALSNSSIWGNGALIAIALTLLVAAVWTTVVTALGGYPKVSLNLAVSSLDNFLQPVALLGTMVLITQNVPKSSLSNSLRYVSITMCLFLSLNAVFAACHLFWDTWPVAQYFLRELDKPTVWENAAVQGRYCGIFDQPVENGLAYSVGLLSSIYLINTSRSFWPWLLLPVLIIGAILAASKVFILAGVPAAICYCLLSKKSQASTYFQVFAGLTVSGALIAVLLDEWTGVSFFSNLVDPSNMESDLLGLYTGGRFGKEGWIAQRFEEIWRLDPLSGFGFGTDKTFDNAYLEFFWQGGIVALILYGLVIATIGWAGIRGILEEEDHGDRKSVV